MKFILVDTVDEVLVAALELPVEEPAEGTKKPVAPLAALQTNRVKRGRGKTLPELPA